jgi:hypothetical protein
VTRESTIRLDVQWFQSQLDWLRQSIHEHGGGGLSDQALAAAYLELSRHFEDKRHRTRTARAAQHWEDLRKREAAK